ncbi:hypothetical protein MLD38_005861 [Melastoma candidum]|uniref:Uncharacterized protein n=1 Tax=Melastoma candidum TaxID=119954 RepID=A0ACB9RM90_9MYRT|nr:hypothetical protein MLD38_005861 [Melastoma candidum]
MMGKRSRSVIGRLSGLLVPGSRSSLLDGPFLRRTDPCDHNPCLDNKTLDNNNSGIIRNFDLGHHGIGLGIVMALDKLSSSSGSSGGTGPYSKYFVSSPGGHRGSESDDGSAKEEEEEDYTYVTFHGPGVPFTMVYHDQIEKERREAWHVGSESYEQQQGFLSSCQLCGKKLHGRDIYMYRGEKGFCSAECRSAQIIMDEHGEQCRSEAADSRSYSSASAAFSEGQVSSASIIAV